MPRQLPLPTSHVLTSHSRQASNPQRLRQDLYALVEKLLEEGLVETAST